jgi:hypothetical protein
MGVLRWSPSRGGGGEKDFFFFFFFVTILFGSVRGRVLRQHAARTRHVSFSRNSLRRALGRRPARKGGSADVERRRLFRGLVAARRTQGAGHTASGKHWRSAGTSLGRASGCQILAGHAAKVSSGFFFFFFFFFFGFYCVSRQRLSPRLFHLNELAKSKKDNESANRIVLDTNERAEHSQRRRK